MKDAKSSAPFYDPNIEPVLDIHQIMQILPHRYPFLLIDKIIHLDDRVVAGIKNVTMNEPHFTGHFPSNPVFQECCKWKLWHKLEVSLY